MVSKGLNTLRSSMYISGGPILSGALPHLPTSAWSCTLLSCLAISSLPWRICSYHWAAYRTSLLHAFSHAASLRVSSLSELEMSAKTPSPVITSPHHLSCPLSLHYQQHPHHPLPLGLLQVMQNETALSHQSHCLLQVLGISLGNLYQTHCLSLILMSLSCQNLMHSLRCFLTQSWSLKKRILILNLKNDNSEMGSSRENVMDYVAPENEPHMEL